MELERDVLVSPRLDRMAFPPSCWAMSVAAVSGAITRGFVWITWPCQPICASSRVASTLASSYS